MKCRSRARLIAGDTSADLKAKEKKERTRRVSRKIEREMITETRRSFRRRLKDCVDVWGRHIDWILPVLTSVTVIVDVCCIRERLRALLG